MSVIYVTNAPAEYDYDGTVLSNTALNARFSAKLGTFNTQRPFRKVELDDRENGYYVNYQIGRYHSGGYLVMPLERYEREVAEGYIEEADE